MKRKNFAWRRKRRREVALRNIERRGRSDSDIAERLRERIAAAPEPKAHHR